MKVITPPTNRAKPEPFDKTNAESLYLCGLPAFVLSNGSSLALFVGRVIDANVIIQKNEKEKMI